MWRVLRMASGLMGVVVLMMTAGMAWARQEREASLLLVREVDTTDRVRLVLIEPETGWRVVLADNSTSGWAVTYARLTEQVIFVAATGVAGDSIVGGIFRMPLDGSPARLVQNVPALRRIQLSPDERWVVYETGQHGDHAPQVWRVAVEGGTPIQLAENADDVSISADSQWVAFRQIKPDGTAGLFRVRMDGTERQDLQQMAADPPGPTADVVALEWPAGGAWMIAQVGVRYYQLRADGSAWQMLGATIIPPELTTYRVEILGWLPDSQTAIIYLFSVQTSESQVTAERAGPEVVWKVAGARGYAAAPDGEWLYVWSNSRIERLRPDGRERSVVLDGRDAVYGVFIHEAEPDWLIFQEFVQPNGPYEIWRVRPDGTDRRRLVQAAAIGGTYLIDFVPNQSRFLYRTFSTTVSNWTLREVDMDGNINRLVTDPRVSTQFEAWLPPIDRAWSPLYLGMAGAGLSGTYWVRPKKRRDKQH